MKSRIDDVKMTHCGEDLIQVGIDLIQVGVDLGSVLIQIGTDLIRVVDFEYYKFDCVETF